MLASPGETRQLGAQAQLLVMQFGPYVTQWAQAAGPYSPMLAEKANQAGGRLGNLGNQAGNTAGPGGFDPNKWGAIQEQIVRENLSPYSDQAFGATDDAIRENLGTGGRAADFVGRTKWGDGWLVAESKGTNLEHAYTQLQATYRALVNRVPAASGNTSMRIYIKVRVPMGG